MLPACRRARPRLGGSAQGGGLTFYVLWGLLEPPRRLGSQSSKMGFQAWLPLPLPKQLVVFALGDWSCYSADTSVVVDVLVTPGIAPQQLGTLEPACRSLVWEGDWRTDIFMASLKEMDKGNYVKLILTVNGQVKGQSSEVTARAFRPGRKDPPLSTLANTCALKPPSHKVEPSQAWRRSPVHPKKPRKVLFEPTTCERHLNEEDLAVEELQGSPSPRWCHAMCLSDLGTAVLIGGQGINQQSCEDALWKLEIDSDFWLPVDFQLQNAMPLCLYGHTATYDPDTRRIYIFGGIKEDRDYSTIYILDTVTWKWLLVAAKGRVPVLTYHSATIYHKELFVFGGTLPRKESVAVESCSNMLYVFNPEHEIWYQPILEGEKPLPRLGHSATLLKNKLLIFGGRRTSLYLSDMHILDLGFMEYTPVPLLAGQPSARCFHAALAVSDQKVLISGGCNAKGALQDAFIFHLGLSRSFCQCQDLLCDSVFAQRLRDSPSEKTQGLAA
ncbi:rab9 effector protein with kelch motifs-like isoform X2 [Pogoniulus pusillus]|uniref:rab9 effector protein with kelch motifs-like isoform X2 n=1 Tax=Pogoniulus pusillus TaxID=488313 RepID=UPI0030B98EEB